MCVSQPIFQDLFSKISPFSWKKRLIFWYQTHMLPYDWLVGQENFYGTTDLSNKERKQHFCYCDLDISHYQSCWIFMNIYQSWLQGIWKEMENSESVRMRQSKGTRQRDGGDKDCLNDNEHVCTCLNQQREDPANASTRQYSSLLWPRPSFSPITSPLPRGWNVA